MKLGFTVLALFIGISGLAQSLSELYTKSVEAYNEQNYPEFEKLNLEALKIHPSQPTLLLNLAASYALNKKKEKAVKALSYLLSWNADLNLQEEEDFEDLLADVAVSDEINGKKIWYLAKKESGSVYFDLPNKYHIEDLVMVNNMVYLTDVRNGALVSYDLDSKQIDELMTLPGAALAVVEAKIQNCIWVSVSVLGNYNNYVKEQNNKTHIYKIDVKKKKITATIDIPLAAVIGSMTLADNGKLYATSSGVPKIVVIDTNSGTIEDTIAIKDAFNLQGVTLDSSQRNLYVADYIKGILKIEIDDFSKRTWCTSDDYLLKGIDGLNCINDGTFVAIQNNSTPKKVIQLTLDNDRVSQVELLENALLLGGEPTNGKFYPNKGYLYIANSQWPFYDKENKPISDKWEKQQIRLVDLK